MITPPFLNREKIELALDKARNEGRAEPAAVIVSQAASKHSFNWVLEILTDYNNMFIKDFVKKYGVDPTPPKTSSEVVSEILNQFVRI